MSERQKRTDIATANAVTRGINILAVRNRAVAQNYMRVNNVPQGVIERVLDRPAARRATNPEQLISEAIIPSSPGNEGS
jgi:ribosomal protein S8E